MALRLVTTVLVFADNSSCFLGEERMGCVLTHCVSWLTEVLVLMKLKLKEGTELFVSVKYFAVKFLLLCSSHCELFSL